MKNNFDLYKLLGFCILLLTGAVKCGNAKVISPNTQPSKQPEEVAKKFANLNITNGSNGGSGGSGGSGETGGNGDTGGNGGIKIGENIENEFKNAFENEFFKNDPFENEFFKNKGFFDSDWENFLNNPAKNRQWEDSHSGYGYSNGYRGNNRNAPNPGPNPGPNPDYLYQDQDQEQKREREIQRKNACKALGLEESATDRDINDAACKALELDISKPTGNDIKKAYKKLVLKFHPDKQEGTREEFEKINKVYELLKNTQPAG
ncbi:J domain-containing protein [Candidatus Cardinium hertigii]|jgi:hypothetical protein|uniref:J domain-containing protein n=1 Tax=Candidatus Cardinium hertigii TaxID=247481 RepID=A0A3N2QDJ8_9BACT|nr:DnaJ domain-containing protein [Candidatus Cardinium hertigii]ROT47739.1 hypothetical protein EDM02_00775 [Candidatus Cardinium hertigii]